MVKNVPTIDHSSITSDTDDFLRSVQWVLPSRGSVHRSLSATKAVLSLTVDQPPPGECPSRHLRSIPDQPVPTGLTLKPQGRLFHFLLGIHLPWIPRCCSHSRFEHSCAASYLRCSRHVLLSHPPFSVVLTAAVLFNDHVGEMGLTF